MIDKTKIVEKPEIIEPKRRGPKTRWHYSKELAELICDRIATGAVMEDLGKDGDTPSRYVINKWRLENTEFNQMIRAARELRAEYFQDLAIKTAEAIKSKDEAAIAAVQIATYKWAASVNDPGTFGKRAELKAQINMPTQIIVDTGIRRPGDEGYREDETRKISSQMKNNDV